MEQMQVGPMDWSNVLNCSQFMRPESVVGELALAPPPALAATPALGAVRTTTDELNSARAALRNYVPSTGELANEPTPEPTPTMADYRRLEARLQQSDRKVQELTSQLDLGFMAFKAPIEALYAKIEQRAEVDKKKPRCSPARAVRNALKSPAR
jgi:hypothetical protein